MEGKLNNPMMPVAWVLRLCQQVRESSPGLHYDDGVFARPEQGTRRMLVNACFWAVGLEDKITPTLNVDMVGTFKPSPFKFDGHIKGKKPAEIPSKFTNPNVSEGTLSNSPASLHHVRVKNISNMNAQYQTNNTTLIVMKHRNMARIERQQCPGGIAGKY